MELHWGGVRASNLRLKSTQCMGGLRAYPPLNTGVMFQAPFSDWKPRGLADGGNATSSLASGTTLLCTCAFKSKSSQVSN